MNKKAATKNRGFSLIEALVSVVIIGFVLVTILAALTHWKAVNRKSEEKNVAIALADMRMQELTKYSSQQLETYANSLDPLGFKMDYVVDHEGFYKFYEANPEQLHQYRRLTKIELDLMGEMATITVMVEYGREKTKSEYYPYHVSFRTCKGFDPRRQE